MLGAIGRAYDATVVGQHDLRRSLLVALLTGGHVLLESVPGLAKTTAAQSLATAVAGSFARIQCTPDLLPSDIVGSQIYNAKTADFETRLGPVHANIVLLDEINRSSAKTQSAMLEAMQEHQTTIGGVHHRLPDPFLVLATQNPIEQEGTYRLPEAQLDRFLLKEVLDYPAFDEELRIVDLVDSGEFERPHAPAATTDDVRFLQRGVRRVHLDPAITNYIVSLVYVTRHAAQYIAPELAAAVEYGASPRASIAFARAARAVALLQGRDHVIPEDVKGLRHVVLRHRIILGFEAIADGIAPETVIDAVVDAVRAP
ncbi:AAA family ATPase [Galbitalea sp. SE-J8]|uniref:AAA family ATPase n=1 Tax=Galbitalea sp. SE-J8 TaxID=3054952 RepID=UPI00259CB44F|nr:AAA family ATPase [Galbitalea sp. SE-J8]MDM4763497.1 AAA family ATPase [Galbitalea sp. SE-J8]